MVSMPIIFQCCGLFLGCCYVVARLFGWLLGSCRLFLGRCYAVLDCSWWFLGCIGSWWFLGIIDGLNVSNVRVLRMVARWLLHDRPLQIWQIQTSTCFFFFQAILEV